ncbi:MAG: hypothetical protein GY756_27695 [bacterium]|nr:hypothetical protein [bacterium]
MKFTLKKNKTDKVNNSINSDPVKKRKTKFKPQKTGSKNNLDHSLIFKIIFILIFIIAIISVVMLTQVAQKAKQINSKNKMMAKSINSVSFVLDRGTGTKFSRQLSDNNLLKQDNLNSLLLSFKKQAKGIINQRNSLSLTLKESADKLNLPSEFKASEFDNLSTTKSSCDRLLKILNKINLRNDQLVTAIVNISSAIGDKINVNKFKNDNKNLNSLSGTLAPVVEDARDINIKLTDLNTKLLDKDNEIKKIKSTSSGTTTNIRALREIINTQQDELAKLKTEHNTLKDTLNIEGSPETASETKEKSKKTNTKEKSDYPELYYELKGKVVDYNAKWGFIIVDLGTHNTIITKIGGNEKPVIVPMPTDKEIYIVRGNKFLAKAKIVNVYSKYSVANVIFPSVDTINVGDSVFFPEEDKAESISKPNIEKVEK